MNLYGNDMDENHHPLESGLAWTVAFEPPERDFIGRQALERARRDPSGRELVGLVLEERGVLRSHQKVFTAGADSLPGRGHQRHFFADFESFHCVGAGAETRESDCAGGDSRQIASRRASSNRRSCAMASHSSKYSQGVFT